MALPQHVLVEQLSEVLGNRVVEAAVFTTFNFDPGFFELHILPVLFPDQQFSAVEKVRLVQLEDRLKELEDLAVYFDASALAHDATTAKLAYSRIDVHWRTGIFHPKVVLLLVSDPAKDSQLSLIVVCQSANITRSGWWENVECAHIEEVLAKETEAKPCSFRDDLITFIERMCRDLTHEDHSALNRISNFLDKHVEQASREDMENSRRWQPRFFGGSDEWSFGQWLVEEALQYEDWNLEIVSPYFDANQVSAIERLIEETKPSQVRIFLPEADDGTALVSDTVYEAIEQLENVEWARTPDKVANRKNASASDNVASRFVHAKIYRFWRKGWGDLMFVGSVNCTTPAHSGSNSGNLEAGFFLDATTQKFPRQWWLEIQKTNPSRFLKDERDESEGNESQPFDVYLKYDWAAHEASLLVFDDARFPIEFEDLTGKPLFSVSSSTPSEWRVLKQNNAEALRDALSQNSFLNVSYRDHKWRLLARESGYSHRPSLISELTADEILRCWSFLSEEQRTKLIESRVIEVVDGLPTKPIELTGTVDSVFHQFSGIFHAFGHLQRRIDESIKDGRETAAEWWMFGSKYDSLPELLRKVLEAEGRDPLMVYVMFLCAKQLLRWLQDKHAPFVKARVNMRKELEKLLKKGLALRKEIQVDKSMSKSKFFKWYEDQFLKEISS